MKITEFIVTSDRGRHVSAAVLSMVPLHLIRSKLFRFGSPFVPLPYSSDSLGRDAADSRVYE